MQIPQIEPFQFIRSTAFSERVQLANKVNEIIAGINQIGDIPDLESQITELKTKVSELEESIGSTDTSLAELENQVNALISEVNTTIKQGISALESEVDGIDARLKTAEDTISEHGTEIDGLLKEVIDGVAMSSTAHGTVQVQINHEDGSNDISAPIDLGLVEQGGIVLQSGTTDRSFKLIVTLTDGTSWQTNDFVIPEGGGTEVSVTSISIAQGTESDKIQVKIGLSDGSTISSNDWTVVTPSEFSALGTRVTTAEGNITKNTGDISDLDGRVQALEDSPAFTLQPATATTLGGVKIGTNITVTSDGTITIPNASSSAAGVMSAADKTKLDAVPTPSTIATDEDISDIQEQISGLKLSKSGDNNIVLNGDSVAAVASVSPTIVDGNTLKVEVNGVAGQVTLPSSGGWNPTLITDKTITDMIQVSGGTPVATAVIPEDFIIQYGVTKSGWSSLGSVLIQKGTYQLGTNDRDFRMGVMMFGQESADGDSTKTILRCAAIKIQVNTITVGIWDEHGIDQLSLNTDETPPLIPNVGGWYRLFRLS